MRPGGGGEGRWNVARLNSLYLTHHNIAHGREGGRGEGGKFHLQFLELLSHFTDSVLPHHLAESWVVCEGGPSYDISAGVLVLHYLRLQHSMRGSHAPISAWMEFLYSVSSSHSC